MMMRDMNLEAKSTENIRTNVEQKKSLEKKELLELPDQIGETGEIEELPNQIGETSETEELPDQIGGQTENYSDAQDNVESREIIKNKQDGLAREKEVFEELEKKYPAEDGYQTIPEVYLRDKDGNIVKDPETGKARRVDFMVVKDGKVVDSIEVTSKTADKTEQTAKEERIRDAGGNYIKDNEGHLIEIPSSVETRIERRD